MSARVTDLNILYNVPLPAPALLIHEHPRTDQQADFVASSRLEIEKILRGEDERFLLIVGPCSIHDVEGGLDYAARLAKLQPAVADTLKLVMRVYFEKPRTTLGWKGLIMDPDLDGSAKIPKGLRKARRFLGDVLNFGVATATEFLDPVTPQYIADLICWAAIGARTTESQTHRQMASGLSMPVGFKNATYGGIEPAVNAVKAATHPQTFLGVSPEGVASAVSTLGNKNAHIILRGGESGPNYDAESVAKAFRLLEDAGLPPVLMIDSSHSNCGKDHTQMPDVFRNVIQQRAGGNRAIFGAMLESNLMAGNQAIPDDRSQLAYGQSITDPCLDWETSEALILEAAEALRKKS